MRSLAAPSARAQVRFDEPKSSSIVLGTRGGSSAIDRYPRVCGLRPWIRKVLHTIVLNFSWIMLESSI